MINFFFDTADIKYVKNAWTKLEGTVDAKHVVGITTNPNAFSKVDMPKLKQWEKHLPRLCETVSKIKGGSGGVVYVQAPNSEMTPDQVLHWARYISQFTDGTTKLGLKIPPFKHILEIVDSLNEIMEVNVTGVADCSTALHCFSYPVRYVSIIPGRMEEKGIDAQSHVIYANQRRATGSEIITGSMRTLKGLEWVCALGTVPTIGTKVWDLIFNEMGIEKFNSLNKTPSIKPLKLSPEVKTESTDLSLDFFNQMDECGYTVYSEFLQI